MIMAMSDVQFPMRRIVPIAIISMASFGTNGNESPTDHEAYREYDDAQRAVDESRHTRHVGPPFGNRIAAAIEKSLLCGQG